MEQRKHSLWSSMRASLLSVEAQRKFVEENSVSFEIPFLDDIAVGLSPHDFVVLGAETGAGKTTLGALLALSAAKRQLRTHYFALEAFDGEIAARALFSEMSRIAWERSLPGRERLTYWHWHHGYCEDVARWVQKDATDAMIAATETMAVTYGGSSMDAVGLVAAITDLQGKSDLIVIDHLHFIEHDSASENAGMRQICKAISCSVKDVRTPVIAIAHLRKKDLRAPTLVPRIDDFHGSSEITKMATRAIVMAPARDRKRSPVGLPTYFRVEKDRFCGASPYTGLLWFDPRTGTYADSYALGKLDHARSEWTQVAAAELPFWAEHALRPREG